MNAPKCHACGAIVTNAAAGCAYCGAPFQQAPQPYPYPPPQAGYGPIHGGPPPPQYQVQPWGSPVVPPHPSWWNRGGFSGAFWMIRLGLLLLIVFFVAVGSCISALSH